MKASERFKQPAHVRFGFGDSLEDRMAAAMYEVHVKQAESEALTHSIPTEKIVTAFNEAISASDRTTAIVIFALIDDIMINFLKNNLNPKIRGGLGTILEQNGILATASSRITMSAALYWIEKGTYENLNLLRKIRNRFAHHVDVNSFEEPVVRGLLSSMLKTEKAHYETLAFMMRPYESLTVREIFLVRSTSVVMGLCQDFLRLPSARIHRVNPEHLFMMGFDDAPELVQSLHRAVARVMVSIAGDEAAFEAHEASQRTLQDKLDPSSTEGSY